MIMLDFTQSCAWWATSRRPPMPPATEKEVSKNPVGDAGDCGRRASWVPKSGCAGSPVTPAVRVCLRLTAGDIFPAIPGTLRPAMEKDASVCTRLKWIDDANIAMRSALVHPRQAEVKEGRSLPVLPWSRMGVSFTLLGVSPALRRVPPTKPK